MSEPDEPGDRSKPLRIAVVGPCSSGKSVLAQALKAAGFEVRQPAQEHSYALQMWQRISKPDVLIYLDVDYEHVLARRPRDTGGPARLAEQHRRLRHARQWCDFYIDTSGKSPAAIQQAVFTFLQQEYGLAPEVET